MTPAAALRSEAATTVLNRLARALPVGISIRWLTEGREGPVIVERPSPTPASAWLNEQAAYADALARVRTEVSVESLRRNQPQAILDPLGLVYACAPMTAKGADAGFCLVAGPVAPLEGIAAMERDIRRGLESLDLIEPGDDLPIPLNGFPAMPLETALTLTEWTAEALGVIVAAAAPEEAEDSAERPKPSAWTPNTPLPAPYDADMLATAMAAGDSARLRAIVRAEAAESGGRVRVKQAVARARVLAVLAAGLEGAERAGLKTTTAWERMPKAMEAIQAAASADEWVDAAMRVFGAIARKKPKQPRPDPKTAALHDWLVKRLPEGVSLNEAAEAMGENPTAITHRLQRKFGMSFSQYVNRLRLDKAKGLLRTTKLPLAAVAQRVGVGDASNLGRIFRSVERMSPGEYRKRFGKEG